MWLAGNNTPDHNTISRFRSERLKDGTLKEIFTQVVMLLHEHGVLDIKKVSIDGTKLKANANKYKIVWGKGIKKNKKRIQERLKQLWEYAKSVSEEELTGSCPVDVEELDENKVEETINKISKALQGKKIDKKKREQLRYAKKHYVESIKKYNEQEKELKGRSGYSKTDKDATPMRMKEDKGTNFATPGYNLQVSVSNQYVVDYTIHSNPGDSKTLIPHLEDYERYYKCIPEEVVADAAYGSEENYAYLESKNIESYIPYPSYRKEHKDRRKSKSVRDNLIYNSEGDYYVCSGGRRLVKRKVLKNKSERGYVQEVHIYESEDCSGCCLRELCFRGKGNRIIRVNPKLNEYRSKMREKLSSDIGKSKLRSRCYNVESVFGIIKHNQGYRRVILRGEDKVSIEVGLVLLSYNLHKFARSKLMDAC